MADPAKTVDQNLLPVQAYFNLDGTFNTFIGQNAPFYATTNPIQSGLTITNSTIDSTIIGGNVPSNATFVSLSATNGQVNSVPVGALDIANKAYVDAVASGLSFKAPALVTTTGNITLSGLQTIDGVSVPAGARVLVKNQSNPAQNGIYIASSGAWAYASDGSTYNDYLAAFLFVEEGTVWAGSAWVCTNQPGGTLGTTPITFTQFSNNATYTAGTGLTLTGFQFSITPVGTAGTYGSASSVPVFTTNAQGQVSSVTNTSIAIANTQVSGLGTMSTQNANNVSITGGTLTGTTINGSLNTLSNIGNSSLTNSSVTINGNTVSLGGSTTITAAAPNALTIGTGLSGTSYNGSSPVTIAIANTGVTAGSYTLTNLTTNAQGQITAASSATTTGTGSVVLAASPTISGDWGSFNSIKFATGATVASPVPGQVWWDGGQSLNMQMDANVTAQLAEDEYIYVKASSAITLGQVVYFTGAVGASGVVTVAPAPSGVTSPDYIVGIAAESIANNGFGLIQVFGAIKGFDTTGSTYGETWATGDILYYNPSAGGLTHTYPTSGIIVTVAAVTNAGSGGSGSLLIRVTAKQRITAGTGISVTQTSGSTSIALSTPVSLANGGTGASLTDVQGGVVYGNSSAMAFTAAGTTGQVLTSNGTSAPTWTTPTAYATVTDDTTTNGTRYPLFANQTTGNLSTEYTSSTKLQYNPSTGTLTSTVFSGSGASLTSIPNSALNNSSITIGTTSISLGSSSTTLAGLTSVTSTTFVGALSGNASTATSATTATNAVNVGITDNTSSSSTWYPMISAVTTGNTPVTTSSTKMNFVPSTGILTSTGVSSNGFWATSTSPFTFTDGVVVDYATNNGRISVGSSDSLTFYTGGVGATATFKVDNGGNGFFFSTGALQLPSGTTAQEPSSPAAGMLRFNSTTTQFEGYNGSAWSSVGGAALVNDTTTSTPVYPLFAHATSGTALTIYTANTEYLFTPSTGVLSAPEVLANNGLILNSNTVNTSYTISTGTNAVSVGPISVATGQTVTVSTGSRWVIL